MVFQKAGKRPADAKAFKLANYYMFGKPVTIVTGVEEPQPIKIDISAIPKIRAGDQTSLSA